MANENFTEVNRFYLDRVMDMSSGDHAVEAAEDIYADNGMKLLAKGATLTHGMQERLIVHRLKKPLETSIAVRDGVNADLLRAEAERLLDENRPLRALFGKDGSGALPLRMMSMIPANASLMTLLSVIKGGDVKTLRHCVAVTLVAIGIANRMKFGEDALLDLTLAGLCHDVGELYINPEYLRVQRRLKPSEWHHVVAHPVIGKTLLEQVTGLRQSITQAVLEHHERFDGSGYPRQISGAAISRGGQVLSVAEMVGGMFLRDVRALECSAVALKIIPGEHAQPVISVLANALQRELESGAQTAGDVMPQDEAIAKLELLLHRIRGAEQRYADLGETLQGDSPAAGALLKRSNARLHQIQRALSSTGLDIDSADRPQILLSSADACLGFEIGVVVNEINWRLRDLARDLTLGCDRLPPVDYERMAPLIAQLNGDEDDKAAPAPPGILMAEMSPRERAAGGERRPTL